MRPDMHKVVVERPRNGQGYARQFPRPRKPFDSLPKYESIRRPHTQRKWFSDLLGPLKRWLQSQVGRPWDDVYSEACQVIKPDSIVRAHIKGHLLDFVERQTFLRDGRIWCFSPYHFGRGTIITVEQAYRRHTRFYVHPETRLLCAIPHSPQQRRLDRHAEYRARTQRWQSDTLLLRQIKGLWFACQVKPFPSRQKRGDSPWCFDLAEGRAVHLTRARQIYDRDVYCVAKRQLSGKELRRHGLANSPAPLKEPNGVSVNFPGSPVAGFRTVDATAPLPLFGAAEERAKERRSNMVGSWTTTAPVGTARYDVPARAAADGMERFERRDETNARVAQVSKPANPTEDLIFQSFNGPQVGNLRDSRPGRLRYFAPLIRGADGAARHPYLRHFNKEQTLHRICAGSPNQIQLNRKERYGRQPR